MASSKKIAQAMGIIQTMDEEDINELIEDLYDMREIRRTRQEESYPLDEVMKGIREKHAS